MPDSFSIDFEPVGRHVVASSGQTLLQIAQAAGVGLASVCGGAGTCEECRIRLAAGQLTPPTLVEQAALSTPDLAGGFRLACQAKPLSDVKLDIPPESLTTPQRLQLEGQEINLVPRPSISVPNSYGLAVDIGTTKLAAYPDPPRDRGDSSPDRGHESPGKLRRRCYQPHRIYRP